MKAACTGLATIVCVCLVGQAFGQTSKRSGGYFVQIGEGKALSPTRHSLIPPPSAPTVENIPQPLTAAAISAGMALNPANPGLAPTPAVPSAPPQATMLTARVPSPAQLTPQNPALVPAIQPNLPIATPANATGASFGQLPAKLNAARQQPPRLSQVTKQPARLSQVTKQPTLTSPTAFDSFRKSEITTAPSPASSPITGRDGCDGACDSECDSCDTIDCAPICCGATWEHFTTIWASALYMRPRNADVPYAVPIDGPISTIPSNPIQVGQVDLVDPDYQTGYDVGFNLAINALTSVAIEYMAFESSTSNHVSTSPPNVLRSLVSHPSSTSAAADFLTARASLSIDVEMLDLSLRHLFVGGDVFAVNYFVGARYGRLEQTFGSIFFDNGSEQVAADVDFDGAGLRLGLETERYACNHCVFFYSRSAASFLAGKFQTSYLQGQTFDPTVVTTSWEAGRVVPILDLELGGGWSTKCGRFKLRAGYVFSAWFNTVKTDDFIQAVQQNEFNGLSDTLTFDGVVGRAEFSF